MVRPADLVAHYSSQAFKTRIFALTFVGAAIGATLIWVGQPARQNIVGLALLLIVASLAELNRRYTYSYLCACLAEARKHAQPTTDNQAWQEFFVMNEGPWSGRVAKKVTLKRGVLNRFLLSWATYLPGLIAGVVLSSLPGLWFTRPLGIGFSVALLAWWLTQTVRRVDPEFFLKGTGSLILAVDELHGYDEGDSPGSRGESLTLETPLSSDEYGTLLAVIRGYRTNNWPRLVDPKPSQLAKNADFKDLLEDLQPAEQRTLRVALKEAARREKA